MLSMEASSWPWEEKKFIQKSIWHKATESNYPLWPPDVFLMKALAPQLCSGTFPITLLPARRGSGANPGPVPPADVSQLKPTELWRDEPSSLLCHHLCQRYTYSLPAPRSWVQADGIFLGPLSCELIS